MILEKWARHMVRTHFEDFPEEQIERAKNRIVNTIGCIAAGANSSDCAKLIKLLNQWEGAIESTVLVHGLKTTAQEAAWANSVMATSFGSKVLVPYIVDKPVTVHINKYTVPTAIAMAEKLHCGGKGLITALMIGDDISARARATFDYVSAAYWNSSDLVNKFGTAATACKLLRLEESQIMQAFKIIIGQSARRIPGVNYDGNQTSILNQGLAARDGIIAADLASKGWAGLKDWTVEEEHYCACLFKNYESETVDLASKVVLTSSAGNPIGNPLTEGEAESGLDHPLTFSSSKFSKDFQEALLHIKILDQVDDIAEITPLLVCREPIY